MFGLLAHRRQVRATAVRHFTDHVTGVGSGRYADVNKVLYKVHFINAFNKKNTCNLLSLCQR